MRLFLYLANSSEICYTYDSLGRVTSRAIDAGAVDECGNEVVVTENYSYDAAGNLTSAPDTTFAYGTNNRLTQFNGNSVSYDLDGNMLNNGVMTCTYDSANRLITSGGHTYTYNAEDVRIRNLCTGNDTTYTYDTNCKLSRLLTKTTNGVTTKYVYGRGLIGEETSGAFKTYHFDCRGSTVAITNASGNITDTFAYDTYGKLLSRTGTSTVIFGYNGRDGVVTDANGLIYMRARYYSPDMRRFVNGEALDVLSVILGKNIGVEESLESPYDYYESQPQWDYRLGAQEPAAQLGQFLGNMLFNVINSLIEKHDIELVIKILEEKYSMN